MRIGKNKYVSITVKCLSIEPYAPLTVDPNAYLLRFSKPSRIPPTVSSRKAQLMTPSKL